MSLVHGRATKQFQDFFTGEATAEQLAARIMADWHERGETAVRVLDPAVGSGALIWPLLRDWPKGQLCVLCCDIQLDYLEHVRDKALGLGYGVTCEAWGLQITN